MANHSTHLYFIHNIQTQIFNRVLNIFFPGPVRKNVIHSTRIRYILNFQHLSRNKKLICRLKRERLNGTQRNGNHVLMQFRYCLQGLSNKSSYYGMMLCIRFEFYISWIKRGLFQFARSFLKLIKIRDVCISLV